MKTKSKFKALPQEDQDKIFRICEDNTFEKAVEIIEKPRPEGFGLKTSYSALRRFYLEYQPQGQAVQVLDQYALGLCIQQQRSEGHFNSAILLHVESRILQALKQGKPISDLHADLKVMAQLQKAFVAMDNWRRQAGEHAFQALYDQNDRRARAGKTDFKPVIPGDDTPFVEEPEPEFVEEEITEADIAAMDKLISEKGKDSIPRLCALGYPVDLIKERLRLHRQKKSSQAGPTSQTPIVPVEFSPVNSGHQLALAGNSHQKTPVKPHYPPKSNSTGQCGQTENLPPLL